MQSGVTPGDRKLLLGAGLVAAVLVAGTVVFAPHEGTEASEVPSTYSSGSGGARAAYLLLADSGYDIHRWEEPPSSLPDSPDGTLLIIAGPMVPPTGPERRALSTFVHRGGVILFCGAELPHFFPEADLEPESTPEGSRFYSSIPSYLTRDASRIFMRPKAYWNKLGPAQRALYGDSRAAVAVSWQIGKGQLLWWAGATPLTNAGITHDANLTLLLNAVSTRKILWDEYFHGERGSLWAYVDKTPVLWAVVQLALVFLTILFTFSRRSGPIAAPATVSRLSPLEYVDTMGGLYQRAGAHSTAVSISYRHLRLQLARRLGLPATVTDTELTQAARERLGFGADLAGTLAEAGEAGGKTQALATVQRLTTYSARLNRPSQERN